jgi:hypothetical protein
MDGQMSKVEILAACDAIRTRFAGRAKLRDLASRDAIARAELQRRLGLIDDATFAGLERAALRVAATGGKSGWFAFNRLAEIRENRAKAKARPADRKPGHVQSVIVDRRFREALAAAGIRATTHGHEDVFVSVPVGAEGAISETSTIWPNQLGLPNSYKYPVTCSTHTWLISPAVLRPEVRALNARCPSGIVYLSATVRVRQGRGTSLVVETLSARQALRALRVAA